jgi:hypothetical protein
VAAVVLDSTSDEETSETVDAIFQNRRFRTKMRGMIHEIIMEEAKNLDLDSIQKEIKKQQVLIKRLQNKLKSK